MEKRANFFKASKSIAIIFLSLLLTMIIRVDTAEAAVNLDLNNKLLSVYWAQQPENVRNYLSRMNTNIYVDQTLYNAPTEPGRYTLGYTSMYLIDQRVTNIDIHLMKGYEIGRAHV